MKYILANTRITYWDQQGFQQLDPAAHQTLEGSIGAEMFVVNNHRLPIIMEGRIHILEADKPVFHCIFHTQALLTFDPNENPILDLIKMLNEISTQEHERWETKIKGTTLERFSITGGDLDSSTRFSKAYEIMEHARKQHLIA